jgi:hypothetical protein
MFFFAIYALALRFKIYTRLSNICAKGAKQKNKDDEGLDAEEALGDSIEESVKEDLESARVMDTERYLLKE